MFIATVFVETWHWNPPPNSGGWASEVWNSHTLDYYSASGRKEQPWYTSTWMDLSKQCLAKEIRIQTIWSRLYTVQNQAKQNAILCTDACADDKTSEKQGNDYCRDQNNHSPLGSKASMNAEKHVVLMTCPYLIWNGSVCFVIILWMSLCFIDSCICIMCPNPKIQLNLKEMFLKL